MIRMFDILFSSIAILILVPFMIPIIIGLMLTGEHDVFYVQERIGKGGKPFRLVKFATMLRNSSNMEGGLFTSENDPRLLPMGKFLRKTKINELPQLINILKGDMSIIGYRPTVEESYYKFSENAQKAMRAMRPGLSGIGSVVFRDQEKILISKENKQEFYDRVIRPYKGDLEIWYAEHASIKVYFQIIGLTAIAVISPKFRGWKTVFRDLPPIPEELRGFL